MTVTFKEFRGVLKSWDKLFQQAADFATKVGQERLISISHSSDRVAGVVTVWCWSKT